MGIYRIIQNQTKISSFSNLLRIIYSGHCVLNNVKRFRIRLVFSYRRSKKTVVLYIVLYLERRSVDDWVSVCRKVEVAGARCKGRNRNTSKECVDDDMKVLGLHPEWAVFRDVWRDFIWANV